MWKFGMATSQNNRGRDKKKQSQKKPFQNNMSNHPFRFGPSQVESDLHCIHVSSFGAKPRCPRTEFTYNSEL